MTTRRSLAVLLATTFAFPLIAAGPRPHTAGPLPATQSSSDLGIRVLARADVDADASPSPAPSPAPSPSAPAPVASPSPALSASARTEFEAWETGKIDLTHYAAELRPAFTDSAVASVSSQYLHPLGAIKTFAYQRTMAVQGQTVYIYRATCANGAFDELIAWNADGKVQFLYFRPAA